MENKENTKKDMQDFCNLKGSFIAVLKKANGDIQVTRKDNLILNVGFDFIADAIGKASERPNAMSHTALGTGTVATEATQIGLANELIRKEAIYSHTANTKVFTFTTEFPAGVATGAITEAGICNAASGGTFIDRVTFAVINKAADDTLTTNFQFTLS